MTHNTRCSSSCLCCREVESFHSTSYSCMILQTSTVRTEVQNENTFQAISCKNISLESMKIFFDFHSTYSDLDPHSTWVTFISQALVTPVVVAKLKFDIALSEQDAPISTYTRIQKRKKYLKFIPFRQKLNWNSSDLCYENLYLLCCPVFSPQIVGGAFPAIPYNLKV